MSPVADVDRVVVNGAERSGVDAVEEATGIHRGEAMATLNIGQADAAVEDLPWVATATVARSWPNSVVVVVTERRPVALVVAADGSRVAVDAEGRQLAVVGEKGVFPELVEITGLAPRADPGAALGREAAAPLELADLLADAVPGLTSELAVVEGELEVRLLACAGEELLARFGNGGLLSDKVTALAALIDAGVVAEGPRPLEIDVRVPDAPVLTRTGG